MGGFRVGRIDPDTHGVDRFACTAPINDNVNLPKTVGVGESLVRDGFPRVTGIKISKIAGFSTLVEAIGFEEQGSDHSGIDLAATQGLGIAQGVRDKREDGEYGDEKDAAGNHHFEKGEGITRVWKRR